jgi:hypothetical protein
MVVDRHFLGQHRGVLADFVVDDVFQRLDLLGLDRLEVAEVEAQALAVDQRALLLHVVAEHLAQGGVQQVGGGVVQRGGFLQADVDVGGDFRAHSQVAQGGDTVVQESPGGFRGVVHVEARAAGQQVAAVTDLATGLAVEGRLIENHHALLALGQALDCRAVLVQSDDLGVAVGVFVATEHGRQVDLDQAVVIQAKGAGRPRALALGIHFALETGLVERQAAFTGDIAGEVHGKAIGVVQLEHHVARHHRALEIGEVLFEDFQALFEGLGELLFLGLQHPLDMRLLRLELGKGLAHLGDQGGDDAIEEAAVGAQLVTVTTSAADDPAQHVTTAFVGRQHAIGDQETGGTDVVGDHLERRLGLVGAANGLGASVEQALEQVDLIIRMHVLKHRADSLQAHAGVHRRRRQRMQHAVGGAVELHEDVVPDLDVTIAVFFRRARRATPDIGAVVVEDLGARAAGTGIAHGPEVVRGVGRALVVADAHHALGRHADFPGPDVVGFVVGGVDRDPQLVLGQAQPLLGGQEGPGVGDRVALEIITEAEVAEHFEERVMPRRVADIFQVVVLAAGAHALLAADRAGIGPLFLAQEAVLELVHARVGEQQGRVVARDQGAGGDTGVALLFEETKEGFTDICAFHRFFHGNWGHRNWG